MALPYVDGDFTVASAVGKPRRTYPFRGDVATFTVDQDFVQYFANVSALAMSTVHPDIATCYLVGEGPQSDLTGGIAKWTRTYAKIPASRVWYETYANKVPGIFQPPSLFAAQISDATDSATYPAATTISHTSTTFSPYFAVGDLVRIFFPLDIDGKILGQVFDRVVRSANSGSQTFTVDLVPGLSDVVLNRHFIKIAINRQPFTEVVLSAVHYDYYLPGVTGGISTVADIPILNPTPIIGADGNRIDAYSDWTTPTLATYRASVAALDSVVVEASAIHPWMGNIWERVTRYITQI